MNVNEFYIISQTVGHCAGCDYTYTPRRRSARMRRMVDATCKTCSRKVVWLELANVGKRYGRVL